MRPLETVRQIRMPSELTCIPAMDGFAIAAHVCSQVSHLVPLPTRDAAMAYFLQFLRALEAVVNTQHFLQEMNHVSDSKNKSQLRSFLFSISVPVIQIPSPKWSTNNFNLPYMHL